MNSTSDSFLPTNQTVEIDYSQLTYCHNKSTAIELTEKIVYWVEGVSLTSVGIIGTIGNIMTIMVLKKLGKLQSNVFNQVNYQGRY